MQIILPYSKDSTSAAMAAVCSCQSCLLLQIPAIPATREKNPQLTHQRLETRKSLPNLRFRQQQGIDYEETFSPVVRYDTLRVILAIATARQLKMCQFDVKTAFLHGELKEEIYMEIPEELDAPNDRREYVCKLAKSLYGLKQASRCWSQTLARLLAKHDLKPCNADASVYTGTVDGEIVILVLFVDDGLVLAKSRVALNSLIDILRSNFEITMSDPDVFVGVQIERDENTRNMFIHQGLYTHSVLKRFKMLDSNPVCTLMDTGVDLSVSEGESEMNERMPFRELIGSLMFLANVTRPDISFAVNVLSRFLNNYSESHWQAAKRILRYLRGTIEYGIMYVCDKEAVTRAAIVMQTMRVM